MLYDMSYILVVSASLNQQYLVRRKVGVRGILVPLMAKETNQKVQKGKKNMIKKSNKQSVFVLCWGWKAKSKCLK
jgi:hypothetical protein